MVHINVNLEVQDASKALKPFTKRVAKFYNINILDFKTKDKRREFPSYLASYGVGKFLELVKLIEEYKSIKVDLDEDAILQVETYLRKSAVSIANWTLRRSDKIIKTNFFMVPKDKNSKMYIPTYKCKYVHTWCKLFARYVIAYTCWVLGKPFWFNIYLLNKAITDVESKSYPEDDMITMLNYDDVSCSTILGPYIDILEWNLLDASKEVSKLYSDRNLEVQPTIVPDVSGIPTYR